MAALLEQLAHAGAEPEGSDKAEATENVIAFLLNLSAVPMMRLEIAARDARTHTLRALAQRVPQTAAQVKQLEANLALKSKEADLRAWEARCKEEDFQIVEIEAPAAPFQARPQAPPVCTDTLDTICDGLSSCSVMQRTRPSLRTFTTRSALRRNLRQRNLSGVSTCRL